MHQHQAKAATTLTLDDIVSRTTATPKLSLDSIISASTDCSMDRLVANTKQTRTINGEGAIRRGFDPLLVGVRTVMSIAEWEVWVGTIVDEEQAKRNKRQLSRGERVCAICWQKECNIGPFVIG